MTEHSFDSQTTQQDPRKYRVYDQIPVSLQRRMMQAEENPQLRGWVETIFSVPEYTQAVPNASGSFIRQARDLWGERVCGNEEILTAILRHAVEYAQTGKTTPILLEGPPGIGKTLIAKTYGAILQLPYAFVSAPATALNRGLAGAANLYNGAGAGAIVQAMITTGIGNPVICIDEVDKALKSLQGAPNFQNELLSALDESATHWHDNYIEMDVDISRIPFVFTANDLSVLSSPLLDRVEVVHMQPPTKEMLHTIVKTHTLPKILRVYGSDSLRIESEALEALVEQLWRGGSRSCRPYQKAVDRLVSDAYLRLLESDTPVTVTARDALYIAQQFQQAPVTGPIGFFAT